MDQLKEQELAVDTTNSIQTRYLTEHSTCAMCDTKLEIRHEINKNGSPFLAYRVADLIRSESPHSLYVFNHFGILYYLANIPLPDKYTMPGHLTRELEAHSFQFDGHAEVARILESAPDIIVLARPFNRTIAPDRIELLEERLKDGYCTRAVYKAGQHMAYVYQHVGERIAGAPGVACAEE